MKLEGGKKMPTWGIHLLTAKKLNKRLTIQDYNSFLLGNILADINNGYVLPDVSNIIEHKKTHYYVDKHHTKTGSMVYYDVATFLKENKEHLHHSIVLGYIIHLMTDSYWNDLTYTKHGIYNENGELIGLRLNTGKSLIVEGETRRKVKTNDFKIFTNTIYTNRLIDLPEYTEEVYEQANLISSIAITKEDIKKAIAYLNKVKDVLDLSETEYQIFTEKEMMEHIDLCVENIMMQLKNYPLIIE